MMKSLKLFEISGTIHPITQHHMRKDKDLSQHLSRHQCSHHLW